MHSLVTKLKFYAPYVFAAFLVFLYFYRINADNISGLFGVFWTDEGAYLLSAKNYALFGHAHFFEGDKWRPELMAPLLYYFARLAITAQDATTWVRLGIGAFAISGALVMASVCSHDYQNRRAGVICFITMLLSPVLFFYARVGLTEGLQFFILSLALAAIYKLHGASRFKDGLVWASVAGALTALLFFAKIGSVAACAGLGAGVLMTLYTHAALNRRALLFMAYGTAGFIMYAILFLTFVGSAWPEWWQANMAAQALQRVPLDLFTALHVVVLKFPNIAYYFCLMPIMAFYLAALYIGAGNSKRFVYILTIIALVTMILESFTGGDLRRNFFGLMLMGITAGFSVSAYIASGTVLQLRPFSSAKTLAAALILFHAMGVAWMLCRAVQNADMLYILFGSIFLLLLLLAFATCNAGLTGARKGLLGIIACCSLAPMIFQSFFAPNTRQEVVAAIETLVPPGAVIAGWDAPWGFQGLKRRIIFTNCVYRDLIINFANEMPDVEQHMHFYLGGMYAGKECGPSDVDHYKLRGAFVLFNPQNLGNRMNSDHWLFNTTIFVNGK